MGLISGSIGPTSNLATESESARKTHNKTQSSMSTYNYVPGHNDDHAGEQTLCDEETHKTAFIDPIS